nr:hypothetical protein BaRGS_029193 [Batillaria attramentaria]
MSADYATNDTESLDFLTSAARQLNVGQDVLDQVANHRNGRRCGDGSEGAVVKKEMKKTTTNPPVRSKTVDSHMDLQDEVESSLCEIGGYVAGLLKEKVDLLPGKIRRRSAGDKKKRSRKGKGRKGHAEQDDLETENGVAATDSENVDTNTGLDEIEGTDDKDRKGGLAGVTARTNSEVRNVEVGKNRRRKSRQNDDDSM